MLGVLRRGRADRCVQARGVAPAVVAVRVREAAEGVGPRAPDGGGAQGRGQLPERQHRHVAPERLEPRHVLVQRRARDGEPLGDRREREPLEAGVVGHLGRDGGDPVAREPGAGHYLAAFASARPVPAIQTSSSRSAGAAAGARAGMEQAVGGSGDDERECEHDAQDAEPARQQLRRGAAGGQRRQREHLQSVDVVDGVDERARRARVTGGGHRAGEDQLQRALEERQRGGREPGRASDGGGAAGAGAADAERDGDEREAGEAVGEQRAQRGRGLVARDGVERGARRGVEVDHRDRDGEAEDPGEREDDRRQAEGPAAGAWRVGR